MQETEVRIPARISNAAFSVVLSSSVPCGFFARSAEAGVALQPSSPRALRLCFGHEQQPKFPAGPSSLPLLLPPFVGCLIGD